MPTPHNVALKEDIAKTVIMPGDPLRAKYIAEKYLDDYKLVNEVRGMFAYTGYYKGKRITVMAHGMGNPSIAIYSEELYKEYDVEEIIRVGSAGALSNKICLRSIVLAENTYSKTAFDTSYNNKNVELIESSSILNQKIINASKKLNINLIKSNVFCSDAFYSKIDDPKDLYENHNCSCVEMESFALFYIAKELNKKASCILTISDNLVTEERLSSRDRQTSFDEMIVLALESVL